LCWSTGLNPVPKTELVTPQDAAVKVYFNQNQLLSTKTRIDTCPQRRQLEQQIIDDQAQLTVDVAVMEFRLSQSG